MTDARHPLTRHLSRGIAARAHRVGAPRAAGTERVPGVSVDADRPRGAGMQRQFRQEDDVQVGERRTRP